MFECPKCKQQTSRLVIPPKGPMVGVCCREPIGTKYNAQLNQTTQRWTHIDKNTGNEVKHRLSVGKEWEISHRKVADDGKTVINSFTGKPAEY